MERHCDHRSDRTKIHFDNTVIIGSLSRRKFSVIRLSAVNLIELLDLLICLPDRGQTGCLCSHYINSDTEIRTQGCHTRTHKFHYLILNKTASEHFSDNRKCNVLRPYPFLWFALQINCHHLRHLDIICLLQKLLYEFRSAFSHCHGSKCAISGMRIGPQNHLSCTCQHLTCKLVDNRLVRRYIYAAIFFGSCQPEHVIIFIDRTANCAKRIMAICQDIGNREFLKSGCSCCLNNSDKRNIMRCQFVKFNLQIFHIAGCIMCLQNTI